MAQEEPSVTDLSSTFVVSEDEDAEITRSLHASLLVQAPLQVLLETLYDKLKAQSSALAKVTKEVDELREDDVSKPLERLMLLEQRFNAIFGEPGSEAMFSRFKQQELLNKVEFLESTVVQQAEAIRHLEKNTYPRLERLEAALHGVDNLAGRVVAMDTMASDLAVPIPTLNTTPAVSASIPEGSAVMHTSVPAATATLASTAANGQNSLRTFVPSQVTALDSDGQGSAANIASRASNIDSGSPTALLDTAASFINVSQSPETAVAADAARKSLASGQAPRTIKALYEGMHELRRDADAMQMRIGDLAVQQEEATTAHVAKLDDTSAKVQVLQEAHESVAEDVKKQLVHLAKGVKVVEDIDVRGMHERLHKLVRQYDETDIFVNHLQKKELPEVRTELHEMRQFVKLAASAANGELRDALLALERDLEVVKKKVNGGLLACIGADAPSVAGMVRQADLLEVSNSVQEKVGRGELQSILKQAVTGALDMARKELAIAAATAVNSAAARAIKSRCLSCDREVKPIRPEPVGPLPSKEGLLPRPDSFPRPGSTGAGGLAGFPSGPGLNAAAARQLAMEERRGVGSLERKRPATASPTTPVFM